MIKTVNLKSDKPSVHEAIQRLETELASARRDQVKLLKIIHGYGSTGIGGDIRIAAQRRLRELAEAGQIQGCIFGEDWSKSHEETWQLLRERPELKNDPDLGRGNRGITVVRL